MPGDDLGQLLGYEDAPKQAPDLGKLLGYGDEQPAAPAAPAAPVVRPVLPSQTVPTPQQADLDTTNIAQTVAQHLPTISRLPAPTLIDRILGPIMGNVQTGDTALGRALGRGVEGVNNPESKQNAPFLRFEAAIPDVKPGITTGVAKFATGLTAPENVEFAAAGGIGGTLGRLISAGFAGKMLLDAYRRVPEFKQAVKAKDYSRAKEIATEIALNGVTAFMAGRHATKGEPKPAAAAHSEAPTSPIDTRGAVMPAPEVPAGEATPAAPAEHLGQILYPEEKPKNEVPAESQSTTEEKPEAKPAAGPELTAGPRAGEPENAERGKLLGFETSKGSKYTIAGKGTAREKVATGEKFDASHRTVYVTPEVQKGVMEDLQAGNAGGSKAAIRQSKTGKIGIVVKNRATGKVTAAKPFDFTEEPAPGLHPVELWHKNPETGEYGFHVGHAITKLHYEGDEAPAPAPEPKPAEAPAAEPELAPPPETPAAAPEPAPGGRFEAGKKLTAEERKKVLASIRDVYRDVNLEKVEKGFDRSGEIIWGYPHAPEHFKTSDVTGRQIRHYITLPDGRIAHPSELYPEIKQSEIDKAMAAEEARQRNEEEIRKGRLSRIVEDGRSEGAKQLANTIYRQRNRPREGSYFAWDDDGRLVRVDGQDPKDVEFWNAQGFSPDKKPAPAAAKEPAARPISSTEREPGVPREIGPHGPIYHEFWHNAQAALKHFETHDEGDAVGALHHPEVGDIDLPAFIAKKLRTKHPEVIDDLQGFISGLRKDPEKSSDYSIQLRNPRGNQRAGVRLDYDGVAKRWLVTAFDTDARTPSGRTAGVPGTDETAQAGTTASAGAEPEAPTPERRTGVPGNPEAGETPSPSGVNSSVEGGARPPQEELRRGPRVLKTPPAYGREVLIHTAGGKIYRARYAMIDARDAIPSHNAFSFEPNPDFEYRNDRDYSAPANSARVAEGSAEGNFQPELVTAESPTAEHGTPVADTRWNELSGNNRTQMMQRVYERGGPDADRLEAAQRYAGKRAGIDPDEVAQFDRPMLHRQLLEELSPEEAQRAITDFNKTASADLSPEEQAVADGKRLSDATVQRIAAGIEDAGSDGTLAQAIRGDKGAELVNRLVSDGVVTRQEANGLVDDRDQLTPGAKDRIAKMLLGRLFDSAKDLKNAPPELRNKLERAAPHVLRVEDNPEWNLTGQVREALAAIEEARAHGIKNFGDLVNQDSLTGKQREYSPDAIAIAKTLQKNPTTVERSFRRYANDEKLAREGGTIFAPATRDEAFGDAFTNAGERGSIDPDLATLGLKAFAEKDIIPRVRQIAIAITRATDDILKVLAPTLRGGVRVERGKLDMRARLGEMARRGDQARAALRAAERYFNRQSVEHNYEFWDRIEAGQKQETPELDAIAKILRQLLDGRREDVQDLGNGKLQNFYENYMPRAWQDQRKASAVIRQFYSRRPFEGGKSFLKRRSYPTMREGREAGLKPVTDNPVTMALLKIHEMDRYIAAHRTLNDWKKSKSAIFVDARDTEKQALMRRRGWTQIPDPIGTVYGPSIQHISEYPNAGLWDGLQRVAKALGLKHERGFIKSLDARGAVGDAQKGTGLVRTLHGSAEDVLAHEIGHQIDWLVGSGRRFVLEYPDAETAQRIKRARAVLKDTKTSTIEQRRAAREELKSLASAIKDRKEFAKQLRDLADLRSGRKEYTHKREEKMALLAELWSSNQPLFQKTAPKVFDLWKRFLNENPQLHALRDLAANTEVTGIAQPYDVGGLVVKGHYWAPEGLSRIMGNHLMPSLMERPVFRGLMGVNNALNLFNLGLSAFHVGKVSIESTISKGALAYEAAFRGRPMEALTHAAGIPIAPFTAALRGDRMLREWYAPGSQGEEIGRLADLATAAGARARMDDMYRTNTATAMVQALRDGNLIGAGLRAPFAAMEALTGVIMDEIVPRLKHGVFADMAAQHLRELGPDPKPPEVQRVMANDWNSIENRLGEVTRDNLFWNRYARDLGVMLMRADQWTLGTVREVGGAVGDLVAQPLRARAGQRANLNRLTYVASMLSIHMAYSALYQYLHTGHKPDEIEDYFFPKNGQTDELGRPQRSSLPSYVKDIYEFSKHPVRTAENKAAAGITLANELINNRQFGGVEIHHPGDPAGKQLADTSKFLAEQFTPFSVRNFQRERELGTPLGSAAEQFVGINPAPSDLNDGPGARLARDLAGSDDRPRTAEEAERGHLRQRLTRSLRMRQGVPAEVAEARRSGKISPRDITLAIRNAHETPLQRAFSSLSIDNALRVYAAGNPGEKQEVKPMLLRKARAALRNAPPAGRVELARRVRETLR